MPAGADKVLEDYLTGSGIVVWLTGLPKSGKTTIASLVGKELENRGIRAEMLAGGILRKTISKDLGFTREDRDANLERATFLAKLLSRNGAVVLCSFVTPFEEERRRIRAEIEEGAAYVEVYVKASLEACKARDKEGVYARAERGEIEDFTGVSDPFEDPERADLVLDTESRSARDCAADIVRVIENMV